MGRFTGKFPGPSVIQSVACPRTVTVTGRPRSPSPRAAAAHVLAGRVAAHRRGRGLRWLVHVEQFPMVELELKWDSGRPAPLSAWPDGGHKLTAAVSQGQCPAGATANTRARHSETQAG
jgi:hypothetical protein